ncbi:MAG: T9SS type A sorting domain-containing protein [Bacteroidota bacterium]
MAYKLFFTIIFSINLLGLRAQPGFQKIFGGTGYDGGYSVIQTSDSGYMFTGNWNYSSSVGQRGAFLIKADKNGNGLWTKLFTADPACAYSSGYTLIKTNDNNFAFAGNTCGPNTNNFSLMKFYLVKTDANGDTLWTTLNGNNVVNAYGYSVEQTQDNGFIMGGYYTTAWNPEAYVIKTDPGGIKVWEKNYFPGRYGVVHSTCEVTGGYMIFGHVTELTNTASYDMFLIKTNGSGDTLWQKTLPGTNDDQGFCMKKTPDNGFIISGATMSSGSGGYDAYLAKLNNNGVVQWSKTYGGLDDEYANQVSLTSDGGYIIAGSTNSFGAGGFDAYVVRTDSLGNELWSNTYGGSTNDYAYAIEQTFDGGYIFSGIRNNNIYLVKIDGNGISTGINEIDPLEFLADITISPNPFSTETTLKLTKHIQNGTLTLTNTLGEVVKVVANIDDNLIKLNRNELKNGVYFVSITENNITVAAKKLIVTD